MASFPPTRVLLIGATSGIGLSMAEKFITLGSKVVAVGRRQDRLSSFVSKYDSGKASSVAFDITNRAAIDSFVADVTTKYPDIDYVIFNAGTQHPVALDKPETVDLDKFHSEIAVNFTSFVDLSVKLTPFLSGKPSSLVFIGSHLGYVPASGLPAYSASKAALASFAISLRESLRGTSVRVVDLWPPPVQSELHDYMGQDKGRTFGMPVEAFVDEAVQELATGKEEILIGTGPAPKEPFDAAVAQRTKWAEELAAKMRAMAAGK